MNKCTNERIGEIVAYNIGYNKKYFLLDHSASAISSFVRGSSGIAQD